MNYCSLDEAWGNEYADLYKPRNNDLKQNTSDNIDKERDVVFPRKSTRCDDSKIAGMYYKKKSEKPEKDSIKLDCNDFLSHFRDCKSCQAELKNIVDDKSKVESFMNMNFGADYIDLIIIMLIGIIVIFILDCFVRLSSKFK